MPTSHTPGPGSPFSPNGAGAAEKFRSILFELPDPGLRVDALEQPDFFADLNLDRVVESATAGREQYDLKPFFYAPLHDVGAVRYRHEVLRDLEKADVRASVNAFAAALARMREHFAQVDLLHYTLQKQAWFLDAVAVYCKAVRRLADELAQCDVASRGLRALASYAAGYVASDRFGALAKETQGLKDALADVEYAVHISGAKVTVGYYEGEPDYSAEVEAVFAKFKQGTVKSYRARLPDLAEMNDVEAQILERVARLFPDVFGRLADYCARRNEFLDATIDRFDREVQFYLGYLEFVQRLRDAGLPFCYPRVSDRSKAVKAEDAFDLALASKLLREEGTVVPNDFHLDGPERIFVVTGPNNGGKTTFARTFGQLHHLAGLGLPVAGSSARLFLPDRIYTHFEKEEDIETLRGKFEDELVRVHQILEAATPDSVIVMNESFNSTTLNDALVVGTAVMRQILELDALGVYVTFVDEIASLGDATVSMVTQIVRENPAERTFKVLRQPADGLAYAWAIAEKYGLTYDRLMQRIRA